MSKRPRPAARSAGSRSRPVRRKKPQPKSKAQRFLLRYGWLLPIGAILVGAGILVLTYAFASIPLPQDIRLTSSAEVFDVNGKLIGTYSDEIKRFLIDTDELLDKKPFIGEAVIAAEDRQFYKHNGVSLRGIARAAWANLTGGEVQQGGSTITQQYVKNAVLQDPSRTVTRKAKEAILAIKLERRYSKRQILGFYLNTIYFGRGAYGIEAAAEVYFDHDSATELTLPETAYLAGIIPAPEAYQPDREPEAAKGRRDRVLQLMADEGFITQAQADKASRGRVRLKGTAESDPKDSKAAYFMEWLRKKYLYPEYGEDLYKRGLKIYTTLDLEMQEQAETAIAGILTEPNDPQAAVVSMTPRGEVRAFVGGARAFTSIEKARGFNYASDPPGRQPGSSFKPFTLLTAIEEGISPKSTFSGASPTTIEDPICSGDEDNDGDLDPWEPTNFGDASYGAMTLEQATTNSVNTIYAQLIAEVGAEKVRDLVEELGFAPKFGADEIPVACALALGGATDVTPLEMARAYAAMAGRGRLPEVMPITYIKDSLGNCVKEYRERRGGCEEETTPKSRQVVEQNSADVLTQTLTSVVESGTATVANIGRPVAGKTGTTQEFRDAWFAGYIPQLATVVWEGHPFEPGPDKKVGTDDDVVPEMRYCSDTNLCRPVHGYEVTGGGSPVSPAVIWANFMREAVADMEVLDFPIPLDLPDEVINEAPPVPTTTVSPEPEESEKPEPSPEPTEEPTAEPTVEPTTEPTTEPTPPPVDPSPSGNQSEGDP
ncbi:MAG TPA: transglycosylase domain-containing protein [Actinomycetota bacterium]|nr:transglycosylase domain-containing protein [Actinomycetota bacterium]